MTQSFESLVLENGIVVLHAPMPHLETVSLGFGCILALAEKPITASPLSGTHGLQRHKEA